MFRGISAAGVSYLWGRAWGRVGLLTDILDCGAGGAHPIPFIEKGMSATPCHDTPLSVILQACPPIDDRRSVP